MRDASAAAESRGLTFFLLGSKITIVGALACGFALDWTWVYALVLTNAFVGGPMAAPADEGMAAFSLSVILATAAFLALGAWVLPRRGAAAAMGEFLPGAALRIGSAGLAALAAWTLTGTTQLATLVAAGALGGAGSACLLAAWGGVLARPSTPSVASNVSLAFIGAFVLSYLLVNLAAPGVVLAASLALPLAEAALGRAAAGASAASESAQAESRPGIPRGRGRLALAAVAAGFMLSAFREAWVTALLLGVANVKVMAVVVGLVAVAGVAMQCLLSFDGGDELGTRVPLGVVCLCVVVLMTVSRDELIYHVVGLFGYYCLELCAWSAVVSLARARGGARTFLAGAALLFVGQALTPLANSFVTSASPVPSMDQVAEPALLFLMLFVLLMTLTTGDLVRDDVSRVSMEAAPPDAAATRAVLRSSRIEDTVRLYRLSEREADILRLAADGHSIAVMAQRLCLSENTVKTYMRRLFSKTAVHSRAELLRLVDGEAATQPGADRAR